jgi:hypothetical protein
MPHESLLVGKVIVMTTIALNVLDELYLHLDRDAEPWSVQLEAGVEGRVDADRLEAAILEGASLGAVTHDDELFLSLRYRHALFDPRAAADFAALLREVLTA